MPQITALFAGLLALLFLLLSLNVVRARMAHGVSVGDGGDKPLIKAMRAQANCAEYGPIGIILLLLAELQGAPAWALYLLGSALLIGRAVHAVGFSSTPQIIPARQLGMYLTVGMITVTALANIGHALF